jgi:type III secretion system (T3SS) SseB-like protein
MFFQNKSQPITLSQRVLLVADHPTDANQEAFIAAFVHSRVGARIPKEAGFVQPGTRVSTSQDKLAIPTSTSPDGQKMLVVIADIPDLARRETHASFFEVAAQDVMKWAMKENAGIIVQAFIGERSAWAGIRKEQVIRLTR